MQYDAVMRKIAPVLLLRLALLVALLACAVLVVEHQNLGDPAFCGPASGCAAVSRSAFSRIGPVPLPVIGLSAFAVLFAFALSAKEKIHTFYLSAVTLAGGVLGAGLIAIQAFRIGAFCKWCVMVDSSAIVAAAAAGWLHHEASKGDAYEAWLGVLFRRRALLAAWALSAVIVGFLPILWGEYPEIAPTPKVIAEAAVPGKITIVSFTDFECPFCRKMAPALHKIAAESGGRVALVRKMAPMKGHRGARPAALAYLCAPEDKREALAGQLYNAPPHLLNRVGIVGLAAGVGIERAALTRCMEAPETAARLAADEAALATLHAPGLPFTYVGARVVGGNHPDTAEKFARLALAGDRRSLPVSWMLYVFAALWIAMLALTIRLAPADTMPREGP